MIGDFPECVEVVLDCEGGFTNDKRDPGGATNRGITIADLTRWRRSHGATAPVRAMDVMALTELEARQIYTAFYWNVMSCDQLPRGLDIEVFDFGVTAGTGRSAFTLQTLLGFTGADLDHVLGNETATAASKAPLDKLLDGFNAARLKYYSGCKGYNVFGAGWDARTRRVFLQARAMAGLKYS